MGGSVGYAQRLTHRPPEMLGGQLGAKELQDGPLDVERKAQELAALLREGRGAVVHTGAGISTSAGIPDFRGPNGIWTLQAKNKPLPGTLLPLDQARPTLTHMALVALQRAGLVRYVVSCNVDSLHIRSGLPRAALAELHGNCFAERCERCGDEYVRDFEMTTVGFKRTGRKCTKPACGGRLRDQVLDWEDPLPPAELAAAERWVSQSCKALSPAGGGSSGARVSAPSGGGCLPPTPSLAASVTVALRHCSETGLSLCLGTSLLITPSCNLPLRTVRAGGKLAIVNLQKTPKDKKAALIVRAKVDEVMHLVMQRLLMPVPRFIRTDRLVITHRLGNSSPKGTVFSLVVHSLHGQNCLVPWVTGVGVSFPEEPKLKAGSGHKLPISIKRTVGAGTDMLHARITLQLVPSCSTPEVTLDHYICLTSECEETADADPQQLVAIQTCEIRYQTEDAVDAKPNQTRGAAIDGDEENKGKRKFASLNS